ncbi:MAG: hypothetical protein HOJ56_18195 [Acidimicrobiaceae bacterium]|nr:hypothetical protein [Acidimicrobiaceae bacterium]
MSQCRLSQCRLSQCRLRCRRRGPMIRLGRRCMQR